MDQFRKPSKRRWMIRSLERSWCKLKVRLPTRRSFRQLSGWDADLWKTTSWLRTTSRIETFNGQNTRFFPEIILDKYNSTMKNIFASRMETFKGQNNRFFPWDHLFFFDKYSSTMKNTFAKKTTFAKYFFSLRTYGTDSCFSLQSQKTINTLATLPPIFQS